MNIKEKAVYDAKKNANRWIFYPTLAILPSVSLGTASFFIGGENGISDEVAFFAAIFGGSMGLIGSHHLFRKLDKKNAVNTSTENIELYEKTYFKEFKKRKLQNIFVGSALISLTTIVIIAIINPLEGLGQSPPLYDGKGPQ